MQFQNHYNRFLLSLEGTKNIYVSFCGLYEWEDVILTNCYISQILIQNFSKSFFQVKKSVSLQHYSTKQQI